MYVRKYRIGNDYFFHSFKGTVWKEHKYEKKVPTKNGYIRYVYSENITSSKVKKAMAKANLTKSINDLMNEKDLPREFQGKDFDTLYKMALKGVFDDWGGTKVLINLREAAREYNDLRNPKPLYTQRVVDLGANKHPLESTISEIIDNGKNVINSIISKFTSTTVTNKIEVRSGSNVIGQGTTESTIKSGFSIIQSVLNKINNNTVKDSFTIKSGAHMIGEGTTEKKKK